MGVSMKITLMIYPLWALKDLMNKNRICTTNGTATLFRNDQRVAIGTVHSTPLSIHNSFAIFFVVYVGARHAFARVVHPHEWLVLKRTNVIVSFFLSAAHLEEEK